MRPDDLIGSQVGNYTVSRKLGEGGMGAVYLAEHPEIGLKVAIKVLSARLQAEEDALTRFVAEAKALSRVNHPNVIRISDFGRLDDGRQYYIMEALEGQDLGALFEEAGTLTARQALPYVEQIGSALQAAHEQGVVHRDLKPENVFLLEGQPLRLKILDFGLAKLLQSQQGEGPQTAFGMIMGTPLFIAPEQAAGDIAAICPQTDLYALGVMVYTMLCGHYPITGKSAAELLGRHMTAAPTPLRQVNPKVPQAVAEVVHRCLAKLPEQRPASAESFVAEYQRALEEPAGLAAASSTEADAIALGETMAPATSVSPAASTPPEANDDIALSGTMDASQGESLGAVIPLQRPKRSTQDGEALALSDLFDQAPASATVPQRRGDKTSPLGSSSVLAAPHDHTLPVHPTSGRQAQRQRGLVILAVALVGGIGVGLYFYLNKSSSPSKTKAPMPQITHIVSVTGPQGMRCTAATGQRPATSVHCAAVRAPRGKELSLTVIGADGKTLFRERWKVEADRTIRLAAVAKSPAASSPQINKRRRPPHRRRRPAARPRATTVKPSVAETSKRPTVAAKPPVAKQPTPTAPTPTAKVPAPAKPEPKPPSKAKPKLPKATDNVGPRVMDM